MPPEDIADLMVAAWNDPFSTDSDPRHLLIRGAKEIRALRRVVASRGMVIRVLHELNEEMANEIRSRRPDPNAPLYVFCVIFVSVVALALWALVGR